MSQPAKTMGLKASFIAPLICCAVLLLSACSPKPPQITYIGPLDRVQEGFLDPVTYQIVSFGLALDFSKPLDPKAHFFPPVIDENFDNEEFLKYSGEQQTLIKARKPHNGYPLADILAAEANQLNPQEINLSLIDEKIRAPMEIKRVLFDNACTNARIMGLYRWLIGDAVQMRLLHGATIPREGIQKTTLDPRYYPPREFYVAESAAILKNLDQAMAKRGYRYEIVHEAFSKPEQLECKMAIHIHKKNLQIGLPFLAPL
ncbi:hypothetical protein [Turneriella parva]|uniref:Lipoprotein n=1 Tax=Turneriella parva (strain ATCC BAA-1111 / DSM 21527 / NCTC 11395 / H) TaxID=869212 RepID=I4B5P9_TURPD|nr:hypothetical protein [Turneriella parva]AFM12606.1 hypothetical protein Turpa_1959 [Turneriella parva DSM 21527]